MAALDELIDKIEDKELRKRILEETNKLRNQRKFGLVFEDHIPECTPLYGVEIKKGGSVALKNGQINDVFDVLSIDGKNVYCKNRKTGTTTYKDISELVAVSEFGDPIYPCLQKIDSICNAPDSDLWHTLIEADNYHALQLLEYLYPGKVDCIYIDPPYNTGAKDWKYNNDYVDSNDAYRHSKWLSFIEKRLRLAKRLLNPKDSALIVTIDEKEYARLGLLLEQLFPEARIQMISSVINPKGQSRDGMFARTDEYIYFVMIGTANVEPLPLSEEWRTGKSTTTDKIRWQYLRRPGKTGQVFRRNSPGCFYPIFVKPDLTLHSIGDALPLEADKSSVNTPPGCVAVWPIRSDGTDGCYQVSPENARKLYESGYLHITDTTVSGIHYLKAGEINKVENGTYTVIGHRENDNSVIVDDEGGEVSFSPGTQWNIPVHNAGDYGKKIINTILNGGRFTYPKSLYAVRDTIRFVVAKKPHALIVDFFAGSGTTLHAVNLLNAADGGHRRCIMVTNNEVSDAEAKALTKQGYNPGDEEWEKLGIARYVTWPRTVCSIEGRDINNSPLKGNYLGLDGQKETGQPMADGFKTNAAYFKLGFLDKNAVSLGRQLCELVPLLWMKAGAIGECPEINRSHVPQMLLFPKNKMAILVKESNFSRFIQELQKQPEIQTVFIITDSDDSYREMIKPLRGKTTYQLYRDYLDNFKINGGNL